MAINDLPNSSETQSKEPNSGEPSSVEPNSGEPNSGDGNQGTRLPSLCTFDVRDKKTTFMTSCYVRKDIVTGKLITDNTDPIGVTETAECDLSPNLDKSVEESSNVRDFVTKATIGGVSRNVNYR